MKRLDEENEEFRKYREQMHGPEDEKPKTSKNMLVALMVFGIVIGVLLLMNVFNLDKSVDWMRIMIGVILILTGLMRAYILFKDYR